LGYLAPVDHIDVTAVRHPHIGPLARMPGMIAVEDVASRDVSLNDIINRHSVADHKVPAVAEQADRDKDRQTDRNERSMVLGLGVLGPGLGRLAQSLAGISQLLPGRGKEAWSHRLVFV